MKVGIHSNGDRDLNFEHAEKVADYLVKNGIDVIKLYLQSFEEYDELLTDSDFAIVIGGDGTILKFIQHCKNKSLKLLGINCGNLGYLTDIEKSETFNAIDKVLSKSYEIEERMMLLCECNGREIQALNEIYINKQNKSQMAKVHVGVNGSRLESFRGDGVIVATPTGSTAYNLSAGGPVLKPDGSMIAITPVCPHMLYARPIVVDGDDKISLSTDLGKESAVAYVDGEVFMELKDGDIVNIKKSSQKVNLIKTQNKNFYNVLKDKMLR